MIHQEPAQVRLGVIGLGPFWRDGLRPALASATARQRFRVTALCDQIARRAEIEAATLRSRAMTSLATLIGRPDVDAVVLSDPQWFGTHALEIAARAGKPVLLNIPLPDDLATLDQLDSLIRSRSLLVLPVGDVPGVASASPPDSQLRLDLFGRLLRGEVVDPAPPSWLDAVASARARLAAATPSEPVP